MKNISIKSGTSTNLFRTVKHQVGKKQKGKRKGGNIRLSTFFWMLLSIEGKK